MALRPLKTLTTLTTLIVDVVVGAAVEEGCHGEGEAEGGCLKGCGGSGAVDGGDDVVEVVALGAVEWEHLVGEVGGAEALLVVDG